ncbi:sensor histidine kinase [Nonomuraea aurantiaca]|uniref:sensor histidine kinase n=1 Tax=Nonomuraea aurantiaca TaxID=2878562 RepID=UPI001CDA290A|nr:histidine kinase [Nonomuraea aurantiaca]MCA2220851.1 histidine kinase [Nonomuraea aurantiaca]
MVRLTASPHRRDVLLALGIAGLAQAEVWSGAVVGGSRPAVAATVLVTGLALAWRRRAPTAVLVIVFGGQIVQAALGVDSNSGFSTLFALVIAVFSAAFHARHPMAVLPVSLGLVAVAVLIEKGPSPADLLYAGVFVAGVWLAGHAVSIRQIRAELSEQRAAQIKREADWQAAAAVNQERARIARELHDVVANSMAAMALHVGGIRRLLRPEQQAEREALLVAEQTGRQALTEMHRLLALLREPDAPVPHTSLPRLADVGDLLEPLRAGGLRAELRVEGTPLPLPPSIDLSAYRILQEAITNVGKHADATRIDCVIHYSDKTLRLDVLDDGRPPQADGRSPRADGRSARTDGRSPPADGPTPWGGHGLVGMRERVALYDGTLEAGPQPGCGYRVTAVLRLTGQSGNPGQSGQSGQPGQGS